MSNLLISIAEVNDFNPASKKYFNIQKIISFRDLASLSCKYAWSPIVWSGSRLISNYKSCSFLVLDYDTGTPTIEKMTAKMRRLGLMFFIGTTKSHQKEKTSKAGVIEPPCDRYRLVICIKNDFHKESRRFKWQMNKIMGMWPSPDKSCKDQARFFFPCKDIVVIENGQRFELPQAPSDKQLKAKYERLDNKKVSKAMLGALPYDIDQFINNGICSERRPMVFKTASFLFRSGWRSDTIQQTILNAPFNKDDLKMSDLIRQIRNGIEINKQGA